MGATRRAWILGTLALGLLAGCGAPRPDRPESDGPPTPEELRTTKVGRRYVEKQVVVEAIDRSRLADGMVSFTIRNETDKYLADLGYEITMYYLEKDPVKRKSAPYTSLTTPKQRLDLDVRETTTISGRLQPGAVDVLLRLRVEQPEPTKVKELLLSDRVKVEAIDRDWTTTPPTVAFTVRNVWDAPLRLLYKVQLIKDGKVFDETDWLRAPEIVAPGAATELRPDLAGKRVIGTFPALKVKRPRI